ncbi:iron ABC transporter substrate-binding protein [Spirochaetia bacterium]|nr:iron ABC transporter substrate-binding protein [Spirochaetia bacterium]
MRGSKRLLIPVSFLMGMMVLLQVPAVYAGGAKDSKAASTVSATRVVKDSNGVDIEIPYEVTRAGPVIGAFAQMTEVLSSGGGKITAAATQNITDYFKKVFPDYVKSNPNNFNSSSVEDLIASATQVAYGPDSIFSAEQREQLAKAGVVFVPINNIANVKGMSESFQIIGNILGEKEAAKAKEFVAYYQGNIDAAKAKTAALGEAQKVRFLTMVYSAGAYSTTNGRDISHEYIEAAGGINVAKDYAGPAAGTALTIDGEQVVKWNPQVIVASNRSGVDAILKDPALQTVDAVKAKRVHACPNGIYRWNVRSGEGAMYPLWLGTLMYPDLFKDIDMKQVVKDFFKNFYSFDISAADIEVVLAGDDNTAMTR